MFELEIETRKEGRGRDPQVLEIDFGADGVQGARAGKTCFECDQDIKKCRLRAQGASGCPEIEF